MFKMLVAICQKESAKINGNTFEIVIESLLAEGRWKVWVCMYVDTPLYWYSRPLF